MPTAHLLRFALLFAQKRHVEASAYGFWNLILLKLVKLVATGKQDDQYARLMYPQPVLLARREVEDGEDDWNTRGRQTVRTIYTAQFYTYLALQDEATGVITAPSKRVPDFALYHLKLRGERELRGSPRIALVVEVKIAHINGNLFSIFTYAFEQAVDQAGHALQADGRLKTIPCIVAIDKLWWYFECGRTFDKFLPDTRDPSYDDDEDMSLATGPPQQAMVANPIIAFDYIKDDILDNHRGLKMVGRWSDDGDLTQCDFFQRVPARLDELELQQGED
jgi:hypothetical protein